MKGFCPLSSGSKGNAIYLGTEKTKVLFDMGISLRSLKERLACIDVDVAEIDAVFVTHEHTDHIRGIEMLVKKYNTPIISNADTAKAICQSIKVAPKCTIFSTGQSFVYKDLKVHPFSIQHDTLDPVAFSVTYKDIKIGVCADLGFVSQLVMHHLQGCHILYIEANHEEELVHACRRPMLYKQRVLSRQGHLSNTHCAHLLNAIYHDDLQYVYLAHLSSECNRPKLALQTVGNFLENEGKSVHLTIAHQAKVSDPTYFGEGDRLERKVLHIH